MNLKERVKVYERQAVILERVASQYAEGSDEHEAIRQAGIGLWYALTEQKGDFLAYLENWSRGDLTPEQEARLKSMASTPMRLMLNKAVSIRLYPSKHFPHCFT